MSVEEAFGEDSKSEDDVCRRDAIHDHGGDQHIMMDESLGASSPVESVEIRRNTRAE